MDEQQPPLRQPVTFWQWLTGQQGTLFVPPPAPVQVVMPGRNALDAIESQLQRLVEEISTFSSEGARTAGYLALVASMDKLHAELARRSQEEMKNANPSK